MYRRGDLVFVMLPTGTRVQMVVWDVLDSTVLVCTPGGYDAAQKSGYRPRTVEYRTWGIKPA